MRALANWFFIIAAVGGCLLTARTLVHVLQLESYQFAGYFRSLRRQLPRLMLPGLILSAAFTAIFRISFGVIDAPHFLKNILHITRKIRSAYSFLNRKICIVCFNIRSLKQHPRFFQFGYTSGS